MSARRGFGAIRKLPSGRYQASVTGPDLQRHNAPRTFETKLDAEAWTVDQRRSIVAGTWTPAPKERPAAPVTLIEYADAWLAGRELKPRTRVEYRRLIDATIAGSALGELPVAAITAAAVRAWYGKLNAGTPTRRAHAYGLLRAIMTTAVDDELLPGNPCRIRSAGATKRVRPIRPTTDKELAVIVANTPERYRAMVLLGAWCALRFGEVVALRRDDLDLTRGTVRIHRAAGRVGGEVIFDRPKGTDHAGVRTVAIPPHLLPALRSHLSTYVTGRQGLVFPGPRGGVLGPGNSLNRWWHPAREAAGRPDLRFHDLRHTGATAAGVAGATIKELQHRLGHTTAAAAMRYQHATAERDASIAARMSANTDS